MKVKNLSALAGLGGALILSSSTQAAYTGLELVNVTPMFATHSNAAVLASFNAAGGAATHQVWRLFATFNGTGATDRVNAVFGNGANPASFSITGGTVYNYIEGGPTTFTHFDLPPSSFAVGANANRAWETWATINKGGAAGVEGNPAGASPGATAFTPGAHEDTDGNLQQFRHFLGNWTANNAAWFITPADSQGLAINTWGATAEQGLAVPKVLLMQITVTTGSVFSGSIGVTTGTGDMVNQTFAVPAPGALALLGLAGLVGTRRRRA